MLDSRQRAKLRSMSNTLDTFFLIGKNGVGDNQINDIKAALEAHELLKIGILKTAGVSSKELLGRIAEAAEAEPVTAIGNKIVIYKRSSRADTEHIELE